VPRVRITPALLKAALPEVSRPQRLRGLEREVVVYRDAYGIPHVRARSDSDAFFAQGFATAQDRLWQMDYDRRRAHGRWAEVVGEAGLEGDRQMRRFQIRQAAEAQYPRLAPQTRAMLQAYAAGVNAFLSGTRRWAAEFELTGIAPEPWEPEHSLAVFLVRHILMGTWEAKVWRARMALHLGAARTARLHPGYAQGQPVIVPPGGQHHGALLDGLRELTEGLPHVAWMREGVEAGSNNWVVGGAKTRSGKPLLAGDPHRALDVPNVYYQNHVAGRTFDVIGFSFPGVPGFPHFAHNAHVAWAITHGNADTQDLYVEEFDPARHGRYRGPEGWLEAEISREPIHVRGRAQPVMIEVARTRHGPVIAGGPGRGCGLSLRYTATEAPNPTLDAVHDMLRARGADELEQALRGWVDPVNNLVYADVGGNFGYRLRGRVPVRSSAAAWLPVPGWDPRHEWDGEIPFLEMPAARNPPQGFAYSANNRITDERYEHYIGLDFAPGFRAERILAHLEGRKDLTGEDMAALLADVESVPARAWRALLGRIRPAGPEEERALALLRDWDGRVTADSPAASVFHAFRTDLLRRVLEPLLGPLAGELFRAVDRGGNGFLLRVAARLHGMVAAGDGALLGRGEAWEPLLAAALSAAVRDLAARLGPEPERWRWGRLHRTAPQHLLAGMFPQDAALLNPAPLELGGDGDTVQAGGFYALQGFQAQFISVARYVFDCADWERSRWIVPGGVSGHPGSAHYDDQSRLYERHGLVPMTYDWKRVAQAARSEQRLIPAQ